ncbi:MAG: sulfur-carrier protein [Actinomycetota bacterium]|jgi:molybdopterin converting factor small subunit|nr:sulfur-carrier protein [Actinomycetota bacterium]MEA2487371.1 sulfur-carrier protein [Actinomycetota bacterium]
MSITVRIPTQLRSLTDGAAEVDVSDGTVGDVLVELERRYPGFKARVLDDTGALRRFVNVYVGEEDVRFLDGLETEVPDGGGMSIIPAVAGG